MSDPTDAGGADGAETLRARRIEAVDRAGRARVVLGELGTHDGDVVVFGVAILDDLGRQRALLVLDSTGPNLLLDLAGNNIVTLGVHDPAIDTLHVGGYLHMNDLDGAPALGWRIEEDGSVAMVAGIPSR